MVIQTHTITVELKLSGQSQADIDEAVEVIAKRIAKVVPQQRTGRHIRILWRWVSYNRE